MKAFHDRCIQRGFPPLDSLVVLVAGSRGGRPGKGYFTVNGVVDPFGEGGSAAAVARAAALWEQQKSEVRTWGIAHRRFRRL